MGIWNYLSGYIAEIYQERKKKKATSLEQEHLVTIDRKITGFDLTPGKDYQVKSVIHNMNGNNLESVLFRMVDDNGKTVEVPYSNVIF